MFSFATALVIPTKSEFHSFIHTLQILGISTSTQRFGSLPGVTIPQLNSIAVQGGLGKVKCAVHTQHIIDHYPELDQIICVGCCGSLSDAAVPGDIIIATKSIEHDIVKCSGRYMPIFTCSQEMIDSITELDFTQFDFRIHFGTIASGDEDITSAERKKILAEQTQSIAVAWEGAGCAYACQFSKRKFLEIRSVSDNADSSAEADFKKNIQSSMQNAARFIRIWLAKK